ncbi:carbonic anhydrase [Rivularia sp. UHCC 0363]|uniref:carbonic anhydrase n=1 Tax=Rivularia sp. UHCC 0363 TaxID=3110244 RepID=UPI002B1FB56F|nr:carbonic anhydrase [Rivularia sp. UHCC 0363]MEA5598913.1 carbonic anhydrase [Rivularia sp. UHCC 0363]
MDRRQLLTKGLIASIGFAASSLIGCTLISASKEKGKAWGYIGDKGPDNWGNLSEDFYACQSGTSQSPVNLESAVDADLPELKISYQNAPLRIINNGHTIQVNYRPGSILTLDDEVYELLQFHFHNPSEHQVEGKALPMELHLVHKSKKGSLAVVGIFLKEGQENPTLQKIWSEIPMHKSNEKTISNININASDLLPKDKDYYRYFGSLTTPPCSETVNWIVLKQPVGISIQQLQKFAKVFPMNARPVQQIERRFLLE